MDTTGLLLTESTHVYPAVRISPRCLGIHSDENEACPETCHRFL